MLLVWRAHLPRPSTLLMQRDRAGRGPWSAGGDLPVLPVLRVRVADTAG